MKIPAIKQLVNGLYYCQVRVNGVSKIIEGRTKKEVERQAILYKTRALEEGRVTRRLTQKEKEQDKLGNVTVAQAIEDYINNRRNVIKKSTIRGYLTIQKNYFHSLDQYRIHDLNRKIIQQAVNEEAERVGAKTVKNAFSLIHSAIIESGGEDFSPRMPRLRKNPKKYISPEEMGRFLRVIQGHKHEVPILLGLMSCRRSEIFALTWDDVDMANRKIYIRRSCTLDENNELVEDDILKTDASVRVLAITNQLYRALEACECKRGKLVSYQNINSLYKIVNTICSENGFPEVGVHGLRHSFATLAYHVGLTEKATMSIGGWNNDGTMLGIYTHISKSDVEKSGQQIIDYFNNFSIC